MDPDAAHLRTCDAMLAELREKHEMKSGQALSSKATIGIVLDANVVTLVVPGSPSYHPNVDGQRIEPGDAILCIDREEVCKADILPKLRGKDEPGSRVHLTVLKKSQRPVDSHKRQDIMKGKIQVKCHKSHTCSSYCMTYVDNTNIKDELLIYKYTLQVKCERADGLPKMDSVTKKADPYLVVKVITPDHQQEVLHST